MLWCGVFCFSPSGFVAATSSRAVGVNAVYINIQFVVAAIGTNVNPVGSVGVACYDEGGDDKRALE